jgi:hypothetical protein
MAAVLCVILFWCPVIFAGWLFLRWYAQKHPEKIEAAKRAPGRTGDQGEYLDLLSIDISALAAKDRRTREG